MPGWSTAAEAKDGPYPVDTASHAAADANEDEYQSTSNRSDDDTGNRSATQATAALGDTDNAAAISAHGGNEWDGCGSGNSSDRDTLGAGRPSWGSGSWFGCRERRAACLNAYEILVA